MIEQIDGQAFDARVRKSQRPTVVDFFGQQCQPCKKLLPILEEVAPTFAGKADFVKVDVETAEEVAVDLGVFSVPTLVFFKGGKPVDKITGVPAKALLLSRLTELTKA
jgi:thioredoxin 1